VTAATAAVVIALVAGNWSGVAGHSPRISHHPHAPTATAGCPLTAAAIPTAQYASQPPVSVLPCLIGPIGPPRQVVRRPRYLTSPARH
jgi:hypothetical protein